MHEARREYQTLRALYSEPSICNLRFYINHLNMLKHKTVRERGSGMNFKGKFNLFAEAITNGEGKEQEQLVNSIRENDTIFGVPYRHTVPVECPQSYEDRDSVSK